jgi:hypothetical protein
MQLDGVWLVDGVPESHPASVNGVDVFWVGSPEKGHRVMSPPPCSLAGIETWARTTDERTCVNQSGGQPSRCRRAHL